MRSRLYTREICELANSPYHEIAYKGLKYK